MPSYWGMQLQIARRLHTKDVVGSKMAREMLCSDGKVGSARRRVRAMFALCSQ